MLELLDINFKVILIMFWEVRVKIFEMYGKIYFSREIENVKENEMEVLELENIIFEIKIFIEWV